MHPATEHGMGAVRFRQVLWQPCRGHSPRLTTASHPSAVVRVAICHRFMFTPRGHPS